MATTNTHHESQVGNTIVGLGVAGALAGLLIALGVPLLACIFLLPLGGAAINLTVGRRASNGFIHGVAVGAVAAACAVACYMAFGPLLTEYKAWRAGTGTSPDITQTLYTWIEVGTFKLDLAFRLDTLSAVMILIVTFVGTLIHVYSTGYMHDEKRYAAYFGYLNLFTGSMLILVLGANLPVMFIGWEGVGLCSFLLIGFWFQNPAYADAGRKAFVVNRIGDFAFLLGMFLLFWITKDIASTTHGSLDFAALRDPALGAAYTKTGEAAGLGFIGTERLAMLAGILLFIGACGKSAQIPLYVWLPDAMAGPTPVSALIHAATMVTAGVYMIARLSFLFASSTTALIVVATIGLLTALAAAFMAFAQTDLKKVLAYSTVSQLGFMFVAVGTGNWVAAIFHLGTHAFFKAGLFLGAGSVMHGMNGSGNIMEMGGLRKRMPWTHITFLIYCLAIAGFPLTSGFFSKDEILAGAWGAHPPDWPAWYGKALWAGLTLAALGTAFYMWRLYFLVFASKARSETAEHAHESPVTMTGPLVVLAVFAAGIGFIGAPHFTGIHLPDFMHALSSWLQPSLTQQWVEGTPIMAHQSDGAIIALMGCATFIGLAGIGLAWWFYGRGPSAQVAKLVEGPLAGAYAASKNKLWVDEVYDATIVRPFRGLAKGSYEVADRFVIDTVAVTGTGMTVSLFSRLWGWFQNGQVQRYMAGLIVGAAAILFFASRGHEPTFKYRAIGNTVELWAEPGEGLAGNRCTMNWDLDGDGQVDTRMRLDQVPANTGTDEVDATEPRFVRGPLTGQHVTLLAGEVGAKAALLLDCPQGGKQTITRTIRLDQAAMKGWR